MDREVLSRFYESPNSFGLDSPRLDLRRAIHNLQLWCPENTTSAGTAICGQEIEDMLNWDWPDDRPLENKSSDASIYQVRQTYSIGSSEAYHAELVSFADCYLLRKDADMPKVSETKLGKLPFLMIACIGNELERGCVYCYR